MTVRDGKAQLQGKDILALLGIASSIAFASFTLGQNVERQSHYRETDLLSQRVESYIALTRSEYSALKEEIDLIRAEGSPITQRRLTALEVKAGINK